MNTCFLNSSTRCTFMVESLFLPGTNFWKSVLGIVHMRFLGNENSQNHCPEENPDPEVHLHCETNISIFLKFPAGFWNYVNRSDGM